MSYAFAMILYLSSYQFGNEAEQLHALVTGPQRAAVIPNALDFATDHARRNATVRSAIAQLQELGFSASEIDLRRYFEDPNGLRHSLQRFGLFWTLGGNSFLLRSAMRQSGFDAYLLERRDSDLVYGGYSAGAVVVTPTLRGIHLVDPPEITAQVYGAEILWDGLALVPYSIAPHYDSPHPESPLINHAIRYFRSQRMPYKAIRDEEVIITDAVSVNP